MADVNIQIGTQGDVSGIKAIGREHQTLFTQIKQSFKSIQEKSPMQRMADRQVVDRKMGDLERKANELERKIVQAKLGGLEGQYGPASGTAAAEKFKADLEHVKLQRQEVQFQATDMQRGGGMGGAGRVGRFAGRKGLQYGGAIAGIAGAYSLFSGIAGGVSSAGEMRGAYANALLTGRGVDVPDYSENRPLFEVEQTLKGLRQTAFMVSKDMIPLLDVVKELGDFSKTTAKNLIDVQNLGARQGVSPSLMASIITGGIQSGSFMPRREFNQRGAFSQGLVVPETEMIKMLLMNANMTNRGTEAIQSFAQVLQGTTQGVQGVPALGIFNLLNTMNTSEFNAYRGSGGANALLRMNQAFTGGGNENFQYFQNLALNPAFQDANARRVSAFNTSKGGTTDYASGQYDQIIADVFKDLGAYATPQSAIDQLKKLKFTGAAAYVKEQYSGDLGKMNIQRVFEQYRSAYGKGEGNRLFMTSQLAKDLGVSFSDVGVLSEAFKDKDFMALASKGKLSPTDTADYFKTLQKTGLTGTTANLEKFKQNQASKEEAMIKTGASIRKMADDLLPKIVPGLQALAEHIPALTQGVVDLANWFTGDDKSAVRSPMQNFKGYNPYSTNISFKQRAGILDIDDPVMAGLQNYQGSSPYGTTTQGGGQRGTIWTEIGEKLANGFMSAMKDKKLPNGTIDISGKPEVD